MNGFGFVDGCECTTIHCCLAIVSLSSSAFWMACLNFFDSGTTKLRASLMPLSFTNTSMCCCIWRCRLCSSFVGLRHGVCSCSVQKHAAGSNCNSKAKVTSKLAFSSGLIKPSPATSPSLKVFGAIAPNWWHLLLECDMGT